MARYYAWFSNRISTVPTIVSHPSKVHPSKARSVPERDAYNNCLRRESHSYAANKSVRLDVSGESGYRIPGATIGFSSSEAWSDIPVLPTVYPNP